MCGCSPSGANASLPLAQSAYQLAGASGGGAQVAAASAAATFDMNALLGQLTQITQALGQLAGNGGGFAEPFAGSSGARDAYRTASGLDSRGAYAAAMGGGDAFGSLGGYGSYGGFGHTVAGDPYGAQAYGGGYGAAYDPYAVDAAAHSHAMASGAVGGGHGHLSPKIPASGDDRFAKGSVGQFGESKTIKQSDGPAYGGRKVEKNQNGNDKAQNNYGVTDANFTQALGVINDPDTGKLMSYAQTIQAYNAAGAIEGLAPEVYARLVANQDANRGTVLGGALALFGITRSDGADGASLTGISPQTQAAFKTAELPGLGLLRDYVLDTEDFKGREWNRAHHPGSHWKAMATLTQAPLNLSWEDAALVTGDSMTSWSGRVLGSNNQDGNETGFANDEMAGLKYVVMMEQVSGKRGILDAVLGSHAETHLPEDKLTDPKINKLIGLPKEFRPTTQDELAMVADRLRNWVLLKDPGVNQGEFDKFVKAGQKTVLGRQLAASGMLD